MTLSIRASATRHDHGRPISGISTKEVRCESSTRTRFDCVGRPFVFTRWVCARCRSLLEAGCKLDDGNRFMYGIHLRHQQRGI